MTTQSRTFARICAGALALTLSLCPLAACSSRQTQADGDAEATVEEPQIEEGPADIDESATTPEDEAAQHLQELLLNQETWVLTKRSSDVQGEYLTYHEETTYERDAHGAVTSMYTRLTDGNSDELSSTTVTYTLDDSGNAASAQFTSVGDSVVDITYTYTYDEAGRVIERKSSDGVVDRYVYGNAGTIVELTSISAPSGNEADYEYHVVLTYDDLGFIQSMVTKDPEGDTTTEYHYEYGEDNLPESCGVTINDEPTSIIMFIYDQNGNIVRSESTSSDSTVINNYTWVKVDEPTILVAAESHLRDVA